MFGGAARDALTPQAKRATLELAPHERDDTALIQPELHLDGFKRRPVFPRHFDNAGNLFVRERLARRGLDEAAFNRKGAECRISGVHGEGLH